MLEVSITRRVGDFTLDIALDAVDGVTAIFGPSGAGKTTLARCIAGLARPDGGRIALDGQVLFGDGVDVPVHKRGIGYVFQDARLFPHLSVRGNLLYGATSGADPRPIADMLDITPLLDRRPAGLSGGEAARVAIGRALMREPRLLILDEPLAALDARLRAAILPYIERLRDRGVPVLYISHAIEEVARLATTLVLVKDGKVTRSGPLSDLLSDPHVAAELGPSQAGSVIEGVVAQKADGLTSVQTALGVFHLAGVSADAGARVRVRIKAEDVIVATHPPAGLSALNVLQLTVQDLHEGQGPGIMLRLGTGEASLLARVTKRSARGLGLRAGQTVWAIVKTSGMARIDMSG